MTIGEYTFSISKFCATVLGALYVVGYIINPEVWGLIDDVNLVVHEAGHTITRAFGEFISIASGSLFQILVPALFALYFAVNRQWFSFYFVLLWVGQSMITVSVYIADARTMQLPLLGGDAVIHDWNYLLMNRGLLDYTNGIAQTVYLLGTAIIIAGIVGSLRYSIEKKKDEVIM